MSSFESMFFKLLSSSPLGNSLSCKVHINDKISNMLKIVQPLKDYLNAFFIRRDITFQTQIKVYNVVVLTLLL